MAIASDLKVGQAVMVHARAGTLEVVDAHEMTAMVRWSDGGGTTQVQTADVNVQTPEDVAEQESRRAAEDGSAKAGKRSGARGPLGDRAAVPTQAQIRDARKAAAEKVRGEHLSASKLEAVQDEAEAELVARMARGEVV